MKPKRLARGVDRGLCPGPDEAANTFKRHHMAAIARVYSAMAAAAAATYGWDSLQQATYYDAIVEEANAGPLDQMHRIGLAAVITAWPMANRQELPR